MRTVIPDVQTSIEARTRKIYIRATISQMRTYFSELSFSHPYSLAPAEGDNELTIYPSTVTLVTRSGTDKVVTAFSNNNVISMMQQDSSTAYTINMSGTYLDCKGRPCFDSSNSLWFKRKGTNYIARAIINWDAFFSGNANCVSSIENVVDIGTDRLGAVYVVDPNVVVFAYPNYGGFQVMRWWNDGGWVSSALTNPIAFPTMNIGDNYQYLYYSGAASLGTGISATTFFYIMSPEDGRVIGVKYDPETDLWSDPWTAVQSDLSEFRITSVTYAYNRVLMTGQFVRNGEDIKHDPVSMLLTSDDGKFFSLDQYCLISSLGYRFVTCISSDHYLYASDLNRVGFASLGAAHRGTTSNQVITENIIAFNSSAGINNSSATLELKAGDEILYDSPYIAKLNRCEIEMGYATGDNPTGINYTDYETYIVDGVQSSWADGMRSFTLNLVQEGLWRLNTQTPPYYTEIIGKNGVLDKMDDLSNMYASGAPSKTYTNISVDFWGAEPCNTVSGYTGIDILKGGGATVIYHTAAGKEAFQSADLMEKLGSTDYPEFKSTTISIDLMGWCRCKAGTTGAQPVSLEARALVERSGAEVLLGSTLKSTHDHWDKNYPDSLTGSFPVSWDLSGAQIGDKLKRIVVLITGSSDAAWYIEDARITQNIEVHYADNEWTTWKLVKDIGNQHRGMQIPGYGRHIMLSSKPYSAFNGLVSATFNVQRGDSPGTSGRTAFGLVVLAEDANNCVIARYSLQEQEWQLVKVRDGIETELAAVADTTTYTTIRIVLVHIGASFLLYRFDGGVLGNALLTYGWQPADGAMATVGEDALHMGIYGEKAPSSFRCMGFFKPNMEGVGVLPGESLTPFADFPASGKFVIDESIYKYTAKTPATWERGPWPANDVYEAGIYNSGGNPPTGHDYPMGVYADIGLFSWRNNGDDYDLFTGCLLSDGSSFGWIIDQSDFRPPLEDTWDTGPSNRSAHTGATMPKSMANPQDRMYIVSGLKGVELVSGMTEEGDYVSHLWGSRVYLYGSETLFCYNFTGFSANNDLTIKDIIKIISHTVGAKVTFSGDSYTASYSLTPGVEWRIL